MHAPSNFGRFVANFSRYGTKLAMQSQPFIKVRQVTYGQLQKQSYRVANFLTSLGITSKDRVMVIANNSPEWVELYLATQLLGVTLVTVDSRSNLETVSGYIQQTNPKIIFRSTYLLAELDKRYKTLLINDLDDLAADSPATPPSVKLTGEEYSVVVFTSGTTASPKGVLLTQQNILTNVHDATSVIPINSQWKLLSVLPLSHMYELTGGCLSALSVGASIYYLERVTPRSIQSALKEYRITTLITIPELLSLFLDRIWRTAEAKGQLKILKAFLHISPLLPFALKRLLFYQVHAQLGGKLNLIITGGAPIPPDIAKTWENLGIHTLQGYGLTETSPILTFNRLEDNRLGSQGKPLPNVQLRIGEDNEIQAKGKSVFAGYLNNPEATKSSFTHDGWFKTGDTGVINNDYLTIQGRLKFAIVLSSGLKVFPEDVELATEKSSILKNCCIVGVNTPHGEEVQAVLISDKSDQQISTEIARVNDELQSFQAIRNWRRWPDADFPRTRLLKIDRAKVQQWANAAPDQQKTEQTSNSADRLKQLLGTVTSIPVANIREESGLGELGVDSLRRLTLVSLIEESLGVSVSEELISEKTTLSRLRTLIGQGTTTETKPISPRWPYWKGVRLLGDALRDTLINALVRIWVKVTVEGRQNLAGVHEPALVIFNHTDNFDGPIVYRAMPRSIRGRLSVAVSADTMDEHRVLAFVVRFFFGGFRFSRHEPYMPSLEFVGKLVSKGWSVAIAPEGTLSKDGALHEFKNGIGLLAVELGVPVIMVKTTGLFGTIPVHVSWPRKRSKITVRISRPLRFGRQLDYQEVTKILHDRMLEL